MNAMGWLDRINLDARFTSDERTEHLTVIAYREPKFSTLHKSETIGNFFARSVHFRCVDELSVHVHLKSNKHLCLHLNICVIIYYTCYYYYYY